MDNKRAKEVLESYIVCREHVRGDKLEKCNEFCDICYLCDIISGKETIKESMEMAILAIEKQIPKKVNDIHTDEYVCPTCFSENSGCEEKIVTDKYCPCCGQRLDFNDE